MGHRVCVLSDGALQQVGRPQEVYDRPPNVFVARFLGSPAMNLVDVELRQQNGRIEALLGSQLLALPDAPARLAGYAGRRVVLGLRPEAVGRGDATLTGRVKLCEALGAECLVHVDLDGVTTPSGVPSDFVGRLPAGRPPALGERVGPRLDSGAAQFFDPDSGSAIG